MPGRAVAKKSVFINCPFDSGYQSFFDAIVFTVTRCGFVARCALEIDNAACTLIDKIVKLIGECPFGIHDLCRTELDSVSKLPRFNMPFEFGLFLGAQRYGAVAQRRKQCLVMDKKPHRFQVFISDIAGQDVHSHDDQVDVLIARVRNFLRTISGSPLLPSPSTIRRDFSRFESAKARICKKLKLTPAELSFQDFTYIVAYYLQALTV
jgi:hypothetical protein